MLLIQFEYIKIKYFVKKKIFLNRSQLQCKMYVNILRINYFRFNYCNTIFEYSAHYNTILKVHTSWNINRNGKYTIHQTLIKDSLAFGNAQSNFVGITD